jgi:hypothetical protein
MARVMIAAAAALPRPGYPVQPEGTMEALWQRLKRRWTIRW